jgi:hypothetical protein
MGTCGVVGRALALLVCILGSSGCASRPPVKPSGYLGDYSEFQPDPRGGEALRYVKPGLDLGRYHRVMIDPVVVALSPDSTGQAVDPSELLRLSRYLHAALVVALRSAYPIVEEPGDDVLRVRAASTDVIPTKPALNTVGTLLIPARVVSAAKRAITGTDLFVGEAAVEAEVVDSQSNVRLMALVDRKAGNKFGLKEGMTTWGHVEKAFREWAVRFRLTMDEAHSR